jgi:hypothetical protein
MRRHQAADSNDTGSKIDFSGRPPGLRARAREKKLGREDFVGGMRHFFYKVFLRFFRFFVSLPSLQLMAPRETGMPGSLSVFFVIDWPLFNTQ